MSLNSKNLLRRRKPMKVRGTYFTLKSLPVSTAERCILRQVQESPKSPVELIEAVRSQEINETDIRQAMWRLVSKGDIEFSPGWRLRLVQ